MNSTLKFSGFFLGLSMLLFSCSMERNAITRGDNQGYGIGSVVSHAVKKSDAKTVKTMKADESATSMAKFDVVAANSIASEANPASISVVPSVTNGDKNITATGMVSVVKRVTPKQHIGNKIAVSEKSAKHNPAVTTATKGESKSWYWTLFLCFFFGYLGAHRFYLGYTWQGWLQFFTLGGLGIWSFIDFVRILIRKLEPRCGIYEDI